MFPRGMFPAAMFPPGMFPGPALRPEWIIEVDLRLTGTIKVRRG